jgi:hypothetical protein|tara:strand:+ start:41 stop:367 length:327 start_codon:yes stop_codon:yes gene_type:complete
MPKKMNNVQQISNTRFPKSFDKATGREVPGEWTKNLKVKNSDVDHKVNPTIPVEVLKAIKAQPKPVDVLVDRGAYRLTSNKVRTNSNTGEEYRELIYKPEPQPMNITV